MVTFLVGEISNLRSMFAAGTIGWGAVVSGAAAAVSSFLASLLSGEAMTFVGEHSSEYRRQGFGRSIHFPCSVHSASGGGATVQEGGHIDQVVGHDAQARPSDACRRGHDSGSAAIRVVVSTH
jgi:hypothetical protein